MLTRLVATDGLLWVRAATVSVGGTTALVLLETGHLEVTTVVPPVMAGVLNLAETLVELRQRAASALAAPPAAETPSRPAGGRQRATSRKGGGR